MCIKVSAWPNASSLQAILLQCFLMCHPDDSHPVMKSLLRLNQTRSFLPSQHPLSPSLSLSIYIYIHMFWLFLDMSICCSILICISLSLSIYLSIYLYISLSLYIYIYIYYMYITHARLDSQSANSRRTFELSSSEAFDQYP